MLLVRSVTELIRACAEDRGYLDEAPRRTSCPALRAPPLQHPPTVLADGSVENVNRSIDQLIDSGLFRRPLAMTELRPSNSMIEAWWRSFKHNRLFLNTLDRVESVRKLVAFYVVEHNQRLPHSSFRGQTPDEMHFGGGQSVPDDLKHAREHAREERFEENRALACRMCDASKDDSAAA